MAVLAKKKNYSIFAKITVCTVMRFMSVVSAADVTGTGTPTHNVPADDDGDYQPQSNGDERLKTPSAPQTSEAS